jgi:hypothetical protein
MTTPVDHSIEDSVFCACGSIDHKIMILFKNGEVGGRLYYFLIDLQNFEGSVRKIKYADNLTEVTTDSVDISYQGFAVGIEDDTYYIYWCTQASIKRKIATKNNNETLTLGSAVTLYTQGGDVPTALEVHSTGKGWIASTESPEDVNHIIVGYKGSTDYYHEIIDSNYDYLDSEFGSNVLIQKMTSDKAQIFHHVRNDQELAKIITRKATFGATSLVLTDEIVASDSASQKNNIKTFQIINPPDNIKIDDESAQNIKLIYCETKSAGLPSHMIRESIIKTVGLYAFAYPLEVTSSNLSHTPGDYYAIKKNNKSEAIVGHFKNKGMPATIFVYEPQADIEISGILSYPKATELDTYIFTDEKSARMPHLQQVDALEKITDVKEKDIRKIYLSPEYYLERNIVQTKYGYIKRTLYLLRYYGKYYDIIDILPYFEGEYILYYTGTLYVVGPNTDPFNRFTLPSQS